MTKSSSRPSCERRQVRFLDRRVTFEVLRGVCAASATIELSEYKTPKSKLFTDDTVHHFAMSGVRFVRPKAGQRMPTMSAPVCVFPSGNIGVLTSRLTARFDPLMTPERIAAELTPFRMRLGRELKIVPNLFDVRVPVSVDIFKAANMLNRLPFCKYATPEILQQFRRRFTPTDPRFSSQWHLPKIGAPAAWDQSRGANTRIAVMDWGFDVEHKDIASAVDYTAFFRENGLHQKASYFADRSLVPSDNHGTLCAGMAIARAGNNRFGCGVAFEADFVPIACSPTMTQQTLARAIMFAVNPALEDSDLSPAKRSDVLSISIGVTPDDEHFITPGLSDALDAAAANGRNGLGMPVFWAVNDSDEPLERDFIGTDPRVIAVGMTKQSDFRAECAFGKNLKMVAPGNNIRSTLAGDDFGTASGTSFATPCMAGVASLVLSIKPNLRLPELLQILQSSCEQVGGVTYDASGHNNKYGFGRIRADQAVQLALLH